MGCKHAQLSVLLLLIRLKQILNGVIVYENKHPDTSTCLQLQSLKPVCKIIVVAHRPPGPPSCSHWNADSSSQRPLCLAVVCRSLPSLVRRLLWSKIKHLSSLPPSILSLITSSNKAAAYTWNHCSRREQKFHQTWNSFFFFFPCFVETTRCIFSLSSVFSQISFKSAKDQNAGLDWLETGSSLQFACQSPAGLRDKN